MPKDVWYLDFLIIDVVFIIFLLKNDNCFIYYKYWFSNIVDKHYYYNIKTIKISIKNLP